MPSFTGHGTSATTGSTCHERPAGSPDSTIAEIDPGPSLWAFQRVLPLDQVDAPGVSIHAVNSPLTISIHPLGAMALGEENRAETSPKRLLLAWHAFIIASWTRVRMWNHEG